MMKILIKGAGDLATGIASRLYGAGHQILMTEIAEPLTVRRSVALSRAVYEKRAQVENMIGILAASSEEAEEILKRGDIAVVVDEKARSRHWYCPDVIVDAILAKRNLGTAITDAPMVIGVGPGFTAGEDCHCVVETKRGHTLGDVIWNGSAIPNTGVPGNVGGYTTERLIRAAGDGVMEPKAQIGDYVEIGQTVAVTGGVPVTAQMSGIVRGMLQSGAQVKKGLKIGDIDARCEKFHCVTISDKARAIGGGVLEAVSRFSQMKGRFATVILAAGRAERFGANKLKTVVHDRPLYEMALRRANAFSGYPTAVVTGYEEIAKAARGKGFSVVYNHEPELGISRSLKLGLTKILEESPDIRGILFSVCDQPNLKTSTVQRIFNEAFLHPGQIICAGHEEKRGNPVLWDRAYFQELMELEGDAGGRILMKRYPKKVRIVEAEQEELSDIDRREDLECLRKEEGI